MSHPHTAVKVWVRSTAVVVTYGDMYENYGCMQLEPYQLILSQDPAHVRVLKRIVSPSSQELDWTVVAHLLSLKCDQAGWKSYTSRWRLVVSAYNTIRIRVMNSEAVLKGTKLALFNINEATLVNQQN